MNSSDINQAIGILGLVLPYDQQPGNYPGGNVLEWTQASWDAYQWNPPQYLQTGTHIVDGREIEIPTDEGAPYAALDPAASPKPTWAELQTAVNRVMLDNRRYDQLAALKSECRTRITAAYGENTFYDEIETRLGGRHLTEQDAERVRLQARYAIIKAWIESTDRTLAELDALDLTDDTNWSGDNWPPTRGG